MKPTAELDDVANPANKDRENWMPENYTRCLYMDLHVTEAGYRPCIYYGQMTDGKYVFAPDHQVETKIEADIVFRPLQNQADKARAEQIDELTQRFAYHGVELPCGWRALFEQMVDTGVRILKPGEEIGRRLTDDEIIEYTQRLPGMYRHDVRRAINWTQNEAFGDEVD